MNLKLKINNLLHQIVGFLPLPLVPTLTPHQVSSACSTSEGGYLAGGEFSTADACLLPFLWRIEQVGIGVGLTYACPNEICL